MGYVYIMTNTGNNVLYIGVTSNLVRRVAEHVGGSGSAFTRKYNCHKLVYYEVYQSIGEAIDRETRLKWWRREWKRSLVEKMNPGWVDLGDGLVENPMG
jgi:putative endonuclease